MEPAFQPFQNHETYKLFMFTMMPAQGHILCYNKEKKGGNIMVFKRLHPGLGETQRKILDILEHGEKSTALGIALLATKVYHPERYSKDRYHYTKSEYSSIHRTVRSLEKRGLVRTELVPIRRFRGKKDKRVNLKAVRLLEETKAQAQEKKKAKIPQKKR
jgi:DNA-binding MarR family transcriptional regulator